MTVTEPEYEREKSSSEMKYPFRGVAFPVLHGNVKPLKDFKEERQREICVLRRKENKIFT